jgi:endonuclease-3
VPTKKPVAKTTTAKTTTAKTAKKPAAKATPKKSPPRTARAAPAPAPERVAQLLSLLEELYPDARTALAYRTPLELLVATILSAQCTDERVNRVTPELFAKYPDAAALAAAPTASLEAIIHSTGFFRAKARSIQGACKHLVKHHGGEVPRAMEAMLELPGVARKTANVVLGNAYGLATGIVVDTHVKRLAERLGLSAEQDPEKIERDLQAIVPEPAWIVFSHQLILHGRAVCVARKPRCAECRLAPSCPSAEHHGAVRRFAPRGE